MTLNWPTAVGSRQQTQSPCAQSQLCCCWDHRLINVIYRYHATHKPVISSRVVQISSFYVGIRAGLVRAGLKILDMSSSLKIGSIPPQFCVFDLFHNLKTEKTQTSTYSVSEPRPLSSSSSTETFELYHCAHLITTLRKSSRSLRGTDNRHAMITMVATAITCCHKAKLPWHLDQKLEVSFWFHRSDHAPTGCSQ